MTLKRNNYIIFTGDLIDYGPYALEILFFVFNLKIINPDNVYIINGNHEEAKQFNANTQKNVNFGLEIKKQFNGVINNEKRKKILQIIKYLPAVIFLEINNKTYQINHGAIIRNGAGYNEFNKDYSNHSNLEEFLNDPDRNIIFFDNIDGKDFLWGDFKYDINNIQELGFTPNISRNQYHIDIVKKYLEKHKIESIISGHQDQLSLGIMPNPNKFPEGSPHEFYLNETDKIQYEGPYDKLITLKFAYEDNLKADRFNLNLEPNKDFYAITLSSVCTKTKNVNYHTYATLEYI